MMQSFSEITKKAIERHGGEAIREAQNPQLKSERELAEIPDDRWLSQATKCIFQSGFNWKVVEAKWLGFEEAFEGFDLRRWAMSSDDDLDALVSDTRIIRNGMKIRTVPENARFFLDLSRENGSVGKFFAEWPATDQAGLLEILQKKGSRLGAMTGQYFLRFMGKDSYILSRDVSAALIRAGVIDKPGASKKAAMAIQSAFNQWMEESGLGLTAISRTLARSIDG